ncbi:MAG: septum formation initiator family protein [Armatimonadota bacterium]|nr:septum formation initiator family protein [Armatimonadota bacterium]
MAEFAPRRALLPPGAPRRLVPRWVGPAAAVCVVAALAVSFGGAYWDGYQLRREVSELMRERDTLRRRNAELRERIRLLHTPEYIERLAREQLGLVKPGEIAVILVQPTPTPSPSPSRAGNESRPRWRRWLPR